MKTCPNCGELVGTHADVCFKCRYVFFDKKREQELKRQQEEARKAAELARREELRFKLELNDIYEYDVVVLLDNNTGGINISQLTSILKEHGEMGWRLVNTFTNELGVNSSGFSGYGVNLSTNATIDQTILIFERCIKRSSFKLGTNDLSEQDDTTDNNQGNESETTNRINSETVKEKKACPECGTLNRIKALKCFTCGYKFNAN